MSFTLINDRTDSVIAVTLELALNPRERLRGLLGRDHLAPKTGLMLAPCSAIHTAFMRFPIDVVFIDGDGMAVHIVRQLRPWRVAVAPGAHAVIELGQGSLEHGEVRHGDRLYVAPGQHQHPMPCGEVAQC